jgi:hypothetical protein
MSGTMTGGAISMRSGSMIGLVTSGVISKANEYSSIQGRKAPGAKPGAFLLIKHEVAS